MISLGQVCPSGLSWHWVPEGIFPWEVHWDTHPKNPPATALWQFPVVKSKCVSKHETELAPLPLQVPQIGKAREVSVLKTIFKLFIPMIFCTRNLKRFTIVFIHLYTHINRYIKNCIYMEMYKANLFHFSSFGLNTPCSFPDSLQPLPLSSGTPFDLQYCLAMFVFFFQ